MADGRTGELVQIGERTSRTLHVRVWRAVRSFLVKRKGYEQTLEWMHRDGDRWDSPTPYGDFVRKIGASLGFPKRGLTEYSETELAAIAERLEADT